jgi:hypothetical protein
LLGKATNGLAEIFDFFGRLIHEIACRFSIDSVRPPSKPTSNVLRTKHWSRPGIVLCHINVLSRAA